MIKWICDYCGEETTRVDIDYLVGTDHLSCALKAEANKKQDEYENLNLFWDDSLGYLNPDKSC